MEGLQSTGRVFIVLGIIFLVVGILFYFGNTIGLGKLPGDIHIKKGDDFLFFPISTIILIIATSIFVSFLLKIIFKR